MPKSKPKPAGPQSADVPDILWCYTKLDDPTVARADAPSPGAWNLLLWAREVRSRFFTTVLPRAFPQPVDDEEDDDDAKAGNGVGTLTFREWALADWKQEDEQRNRDVPVEIITDAEQLVRNWNRMARNELSEEAMTAMTSHVAFAVHLAVRAAAQWPEKFAEYLEDAEGWDIAFLAQMADAVERFRGDPSVSQDFTVQAEGSKNGLQASR